jgi:uncharacterized membrane protein YhiD involved in acid resistance
VVMSIKLVAGVVVGVVVGVERACSSQRVN